MMGVKCPSGSTLSSANQTMGISRPAIRPPPRAYDLDLFNEPVSAATFEREYQHKMKAFLDRDDAIAFAYHCNLVGVMRPAYDRVGAEWVYNSEETGRSSEVRRQEPSDAVDRGQGGAFGVSCAGV